MKGKFLLAGIAVFLFSMVSVAAQAKFNTSLHFTRVGKKAAYQKENGGFEVITGIPIENLSCQKCHASPNAAGQPIDPATYVPNCSDCHDAQFKVRETTCLNCHKRQALERAQFPGVDVHQAAGLTCMDCHSKQELHGDDGVAYTSLKEPGAIKVTCEQAGCHSEVAMSPSHSIHAATVDCAACHTASVVNCVSCHFETLIEGGGQRPNNQIQGYKLLLMNQGKADVGALNSHTFNGQTNVILSSFHSHLITEDASECADCHFNFGGTNAAIAEYNQSGMITVNKWNEQSKKIEGPQGVVPIPNDWRTALLFDYAVYTGDPAEAASDPEAWEFLKTGSDNAHLFFAQPLDADAMRKLGMNVQGLIDTFYFPVFGDGAAADIQLKTGLTLTNVGDGALLDLEFYDINGAPLQVVLDGQGPDSTFEVPVSQGRTFSVETPGAGGLKVGYIVVKVTTPNGSQPAGFSDASTHVGGTAVFTRSDGGVIVTEAGVPGARPMTDFTLFLDSMGRRDTGLAIVNPPGTVDQPGSAATVTLAVWDPDFTGQIAQADVDLAPGASVRQFIWEIFRDAGADSSVYEPLRETTANVTVTSNVAVAALVIRQNDDPAIVFPDEVPTLTVFPVIPGRADAMAASAAK